MFSIVLMWLQLLAVSLFWWAFCFLFCCTEYAGVDIYNSESHKQCWPSQQHRMDFMRSYLRARVGLYQASGAHNEMLEVIAKMVDNAEVFDQICTGLDVSTGIVAL